MSRDGLHLDILAASSAAQEKKIQCSSGKRGTPGPHSLGGLCPTLPGRTAAVGNIDFTSCQQKIHWDGDRGTKTSSVPYPSPLAQAQCHSLTPNSSSPFSPHSSLPHGVFLCLNPPFPSLNPLFPSLKPLFLRLTEGWDVPSAEACASLSPGQLPPLLTRTAQALPGH